MGHSGYRIAIAVLGVIVFVFGWVTAISAGYTSGSDFTMLSQDGMSVVYSVDEQVQDSEGHPLQVPVFEGSEQGALAYMEQQSTDAELLVPRVFNVAGVLLVVVALIPLRKTTEDRPSA